MQVQLLVPDSAARGGAAAATIVPVGAGGAGGGERNAFAQLVDAAGAILDGADRAERAFVQRRGGLQEMVVERARADVALAIATSAAQRATQAISSVLGMQI